MATYIILANFTDQGIRNVKDSPKREDAFRKLCEKMGARVKEAYRTMGRYDVAAIVDAPDDVAMNAILYALGGARQRSHRDAAGVHAARDRRGHRQDDVVFALGGGWHHRVEKPRPGMPRYEFLGEKCKKRFELTMMPATPQINSGRLECS